MTTPVMTSMHELEDRFFDLVDRVEAPMVRWTGDFAGTMADRTPERPEWPWLERVPTFPEVVDFNVDFVNRFVRQQTSFVRKMMKAANPTLTKYYGTAPASVRKAARKVA